MKILQIKFKNINSLKGEHHIDFEQEPLKSNALFAITGPTGSGKSTLLDVICLALFNKVPRMGKVSKSEISKTGSVITRHQKQAFAQVTYLCKSGKFVSHWDIQYNRNNNLNDYEMQIKNLDTNEELDLKKSEVPPKNEELIGLNYEQFVKSILLAQGEFSKFLKASDNERKQILEQITGTEIYRKVGMLAFEKAKLVKSTIELDLQRISDLQEKLVDEAVIKSFENELAKSKLQKEKQTDLLSQLKSQIELEERRKNLQTKLQKSEEAKVKIIQQQSDFEKKHLTALKQHQKTQDFAEELQTWEQEQKVLLELKKNQESLKNEIQNLKTQQDQNLLKIEKLIQLPIKKEEVLTALEKFRKQVSQLQNQLNEARKTFSIKKLPVEEKLNHLKIQTDFKDLEQTHLRLKNQQNQWEEKLKETKNFLGQHSSITQELKEVYLEINQKIEHSLEAKQLEQQLSQVQKKLKELEPEIKVLEEKLSKNQPDLKALENDLASAKMKLENLNLKLTNQRLILSFEQHRSKLQPGEECPLCGALEHPFIQHQVPIESDLEVKIKTQKDHLQKLEKEVKSLQNLVITQAKEKENKEKQYSDLTSELKTLKLQWNSDFEQLQQEKEYLTWEEYVSLLKEILLRFQEKDEVEEKINQLDGVFSQLKELQELLVKGKDLKTELNQIYAGDDVDTEVNQLKSAWEKNSQQQATKKEDSARLVSQLNQKNLIFEELQNNLIGAVQKVGFENIEESRLARMKERDFQSLQNQQNELSNKLQIAINEIERLKEQLAELQANLAEKELSHLLIKKKEVETSIEVLEKEILNCTNQLLNQEKLNEEIEQIQKRIQVERQKSEKWLLLSELIGDAKGAKFNNFAQDLTLMHLLSMANHRLTKLNDRYQMDRPNKEEGEDLVAIDLHMGSERRSVKTLSGGETFMLSLALALALSDLASQNVKIDSLFIDEGFGTLDPETLDQTLDTLERLQAESNKTIGIISHVDALKERIQTQIQLTKNGQGYSSLKVVN
ncbi:MAG: AAA family ATPase [Flavobacteriaceae bacterium]|nr:AAA family ATPase [Flavobacteriaceae bacterium]